MSNDIFWAIKGVHGFYTGTQLTKYEAITAHVRSKSFPFRYPSSDQRRKDWVKFRGRGDRAVKVQLVETGR